MKRHFADGKKILFIARPDAATHTVATAVHPDWALRIAEALNATFPAIGMVRFLYHFTATERDTERYHVGEILTVRMVGFDQAAELPVVENVESGDQFTVQPHELRRVSEA